MDPITADLLFTAMLSASLLVASGVALSLLPRTPDQISATAASFGRIGQRAHDTARHKIEQAMVVRVFVRD